MFIIFRKKAETAQQSAPPAAAAVNNKNPNPVKRKRPVAKKPPNSGQFVRITLIYFVYAFNSCNSRAG